MILYGEGGTGKSKVIQTITSLFRQRGVEDILQKTSYTGIAASLIDGQTMHTLAGMSLKRKGKMSSDCRRRLEETWANKHYLIIDEYSMISKTFLQKFALKIKQARKCVDDEDWWGGLNVIMCGDFHQFPPVAVGRSECLFKPTENEEAHPRVIGRQIYEGFSMVVILKQQRRVKDEEWLQFLRRLRNGRVITEDIAMLRNLVLSPSARGDMMDNSWNDMSLITPRHAVRTRWNDQACREMCSSLGRTLFICAAKDFSGDSELTREEQLRLRKRLTVKKLKSLPDEIEIAIGMKVLVTYNVETSLDITNGARGTISNIIFDAREDMNQCTSVQRLQYLPKYILVHMNRTKVCKLSGLPDNVIPIEPISMRMDVQMENGKSMVVRRTQFPITGAYAFTDYRSQGQTISRAIIDIAPPPRGSLNLFNLYVALSRCPDREHIRLLREFKEEMLLKKHEESLIREDERLECMEKNTTLWWNEVRCREES